MIQVCHRWRGDVGIRGPADPSGGNSSSSSSLIPAPGVYIRDSD